MTLPQKLRDRGDCLRIRGRELAQIDFFPRPAGPHRRQRRNGAGMGINSAYRVGVPAFRAARVEQKIVKIPKNEIVIALGRSKAAAASSVDLQKDLGIEEQGEKLEARKIVVPTRRV